MVGLGAVKGFAAVEPEGGTGDRGATGPDRNPEAKSMIEGPVVELEPDAKDGTVGVGNEYPPASHQPVSGRT
jgi:hypothetical protein